ncbi:MAG: putative toxin-antitoxin system toxin component, PIN family [Blastocatellia bacterium]
MDKVQIVIDTNVLVAAFRSKRGAANQLILSLDDERFEIAISTPLLFEYEDVLKRPEMSQFLSHEEVDGAIESLRLIANEYAIFFLWRMLAVDPDDAFILELAIRSNAKYIITYNPKDFASAADFGITLVTSRDFLALMEK